MCSGLSYKGSTYRIEATRYENGLPFLIAPISLNAQSALLYRFTASVEVAWDCFVSQLHVLNQYILVLHYYY